MSGAAASDAMSENDNDQPAEKTSESETKRQKTLHEVERRIAFTDAAVAVAMTLLVLPLMEAAKDFESETMRDFFVDNKKHLISFVVSYAIIYLAWTRQDHLFRYVNFFTRGLSSVNFLWLLFITYTPVSSLLMTTLPVGGHDYVALQQVVVYALIGICQLGMIIIVRAVPDTWSESGRPPLILVVKELLWLTLLGVVAGLVFTPMGVNSFFILCLYAPLTKILPLVLPGLEEE